MISLLLSALIFASLGHHHTAAEHIDGAEFFSKWLVTNYGNRDGGIDVEGLTALLVQIQPRIAEDTHREEAMRQRATSVSPSAPSDPCDGSAWMSNKTCLQRKCLLAPDIFRLHAVPGSSVNASGLQRMSTTVLYAAIGRACAKAHTESATKLKRISTKTEAWGYGFLSVTIINMCAFGGLLVLPITKTRYYQATLLFMVSLAVGTLCGSSLLILIPESFDLASSEYADIYVWRLLTVIGGIYLFFLTERLMSNIMDARKLKKHSHSPSAERELPTLPPCSVTLHTDAKQPDHLTAPFETPVNPPAVHQSPSTTKLDPMGDMDEENQIQAAEETNGIRSLAWMVITGDGLHNFVDGLSIGAAFAHSPLAGASVSVAVFCEELPHELGDFAILLNAGMSVKQAVFFNGLSACTCYIGLVVGIIAGETPDGSYWIFSIAAGMFLYISLVDMLPEINRAAEESVQRGECRWRALIIQNAGLLTGWTAMLLLALYSGNIKFH